MPAQHQPATARCRSCPATTGYGGVVFLADAVFLAAGAALVRQPAPISSPRVQSSSRPVRSSWPPGLPSSSPVLSSSPPVRSSPAPRPSSRQERPCASCGAAFFAAGVAVLLGRCRLLRRWCGLRRRRGLPSSLLWSSSADAFLTGGAAFLATAAFLTGTAVFTGSAVLTGSVGFRPAAVGFAGSAGGPVRSRLTALAAGRSPDWRSGIGRADRHLGCVRSASRSPPVGASPSVGSSAADPGSGSAGAGTTSTSVYAGSANEPVDRTWVPAQRRRPRPGRQRSRPADAGRCRTADPERDEGKHRHHDGRVDPVQPHRRNQPDDQQHDRRKQQNSADDDHAVDSVSMTSERGGLAISGGIRRFDATDRRRGPTARLSSADPTTPVRGSVGQSGRFVRLAVVCL